MPECQLPGIAYGASMVVGKSSGNAVRLLSGMLINTCFRPILLKNSNTEFSACFSGSV